VAVLVAATGRLLVVALEPQGKVLPAAAELPMLALAAAALEKRVAQMELDSVGMVFLRQLLVHQLLEAVVVVVDARQMEAPELVGMVAVLTEQQHKKKTMEL
jgi:hypothetical protein